MRCRPGDPGRDARWLATLPSLNESARWGDLTTALIDNIEHVVIGKRDQIELVLCALLCEGHVLLDDVPGTAKTVLARAIARSDRRRHDRPDPVHARPAADRRDRAVGLRPARAGVRVPARAGVHEHPARRRDQPRDAADPERAARGDGGAPDHGGRRVAPPRRARSSSSRRRTRSTTRASSRSPRPSSTASSSRRRSATRSPTRSS